MAFRLFLDMKRVLTISPCRYQVAVRSIAIDMSAGLAHDLSDLVVVVVFVALLMGFRSAGLVDGWRGRRYPDPFTLA